MCPQTPSETSTSWYEGRRLLNTKPSTRKFLLLFPECLEEGTRSRSSPLAMKNAAQGGSTLDWAGMEERGVFPTSPRSSPSWHLHPGQKPTMMAASKRQPQAHAAGHSK